MKRHLFKFLPLFIGLFWAWGAYASMGTTIVDSQPVSYQGYYHEAQIDPTIEVLPTKAEIPIPKPKNASGPLYGAVTGDVWYQLRLCEAGNDYTKNTGNGYYGAYQFSYSTWQSMKTGYERADLAPPSVQDDAAQRLQARSGWGQWPACARKLGLI